MYVFYFSRMSFNRFWIIQQTFGLCEELDLLTMSLEQAPDKKYIWIHAVEAIVAVLVASVIFVLMFVLYKIGRKWAIKRRGQGTLRLFPSMLYSEIENIDLGDTTCRICLSDFESTENICILPCTHLYHSECISTWMSREITCPTCRRNYGHVYRSWISYLI